ncbi:MAG: restriction endonuclease subunit S [Mycobacteriales bacterium]
MRGDLLLTRSGSLGLAHLVTDAQASCTFAGFLVRFRPRVDTNSRWLYYVTQSLAFQQAVAAEAVSSTISNFNAERYANLRVPFVAVTEQRRIADFLDDQVARLDAAAARTRILRERFEERVDSLWTEAYQGCLDQGSLVPLRRVLASIVDGPFGSSLTSAHYTDAGVRVIRLGNLGLAQFRDDDAAYISEAYGRELRQHAVQPGDVLMAGLGDERWPLGRAVVAPEHLGPAIVKADCYRLRPVAGVDPRYLAVALSAPQSRESIRQLARGSTRARLNTEVAREVPVARVGPDQHSEPRRRRQRVRVGAGRSGRLKLATRALFDSCAAAHGQWADLDIPRRSLAPFTSRCSRASGRRALRTKPGPAPTGARAECPRAGERSARARHRRSRTRMDLGRARAA